MRKPSIAWVVAAVLSAAGCTQQQSTSSRIHPSAPASSADGSAAAQAALLPGDPHAVDRATTASDYCVACHPWADDSNNHPVRVSYLIPASGGGYVNPPDPAIVLRAGVWLECSSCHDDGSAGFPKRTVLQDTCSGCHDKSSAANPPFVVLASPADDSIVSGQVTVAASAIGAVRTQLWGGPSAYETELLDEVAYGGNVTLQTITNGRVPNGKYVYLVRGYDAAGGNGSAYVTVTVSNGLAVAIQSPAASSVVSGTIAVVAQTPGAVRAELYVAGYAWATAEPTGDTVTFAVDTTLLQNGTAELVVRGYDATGYSESASTSVVVDNPHPPAEVSIQSPATNALVRGTLQVLATTVNAVGTAELWILREVGDGAIVATAPVQADGSVAFSLDTAALADGSALLSVRVDDTWGGTASRTTGVVLDNTAPAIVLASPPSGATIRGTTTIVATAADASGVVSVAFYVDGALLGTSSAAPYAVAWTPARRSGSHTLAAVATDAAGNEGTSAPFAVQVK